jgi:ketosteroid isomerase-like protein
MPKSLHLLVISTLLLVLSRISLGAQDPAGQAVVKLENAWAAADAKHDAAAVGRLLASDFTFVLPDGTLSTRAQVLGRVTSDTGGPGPVNSDLKPRVYGNTVVITGLTTYTTKAEQRRLRWTDTWVKGPDGQWICVAAQTAMVRAN